MGGSPAITLAGRAPNKKIRAAKGRRYLCTITFRLHSEKVPDNGRICFTGSFRTGKRTTSLATVGQHQTDKTAIDARQETEFQEKSRQTAPIQRSTAR